jgi:hypothetical protein
MSLAAQAGHGQIALFLLSAKHNAQQQKQQQKQQQTQQTQQQTQHGSTTRSSGLAVESPSRTPSDPGGQAAGRGRGGRADQMHVAAQAVLCRLVANSAAAEQSFDVTRLANSGTGEKPQTSLNAGAGGDGASSKGGGGGGGDGGDGGDDCDLFSLDPESAGMLKLTIDRRKLRGRGGPTPDCHRKRRRVDTDIDAVERVHGKFVCELFEGVCGYGCGCHNTNTVSADWVEEIAIAATVGEEGTGGIRQYSEVQDGFD